MMSIPKALIFAALILAFSFSLTLAVRSDLIDGSTQQRAQGVMIGMVLVIFANLVPKTLEPLSATRCGRSKTQAVQRFTGWTLVLAGLGYSIAWLVLPIEHARVPAMSLVASGLLLVLARVAWAFARGSRAQPPTEM